MHRWPLFIALATLLMYGKTAKCLAQPELSFSSPSAVLPGETIELTLGGKKLDGPFTIWTSFSSECELVNEQGDQEKGTTRRCRIAVPADAAVGIGGIVMGTPAGASEMLFVMIDDLATVADNGENHTLDSAQHVELPVAVDGVGDGAKLDYYEFQAAAGQRLAVEVVAARLGSAFDPVVRLLDEDGQELWLIDDDPSLGADCRQAYTFSRDGKYFLEVHDNRYRRGDRYRLRIGDFPLVTVPFPLGARRGSTARYEFAGPESHATTPVILNVPSDESRTQIPLSVRVPGGKSSGMARLAATRLPELTEVEPNDAGKVATPVTFPCALNGILESPGDCDSFSFAAAKGESFAFDTISRSLGSPSIPTIRILDSKGKSLAETKVSDADETTLRYTFPKDGMYCLMVEDLLRRGGSDYAYRVEIDHGSGFSLSLKNDKNAKLAFPLASGSGALMLEVQIARRGYDGPIEFHLEGGAGRLELLHPHAPSKSKSHRLVLRPAGTCKPGDLEVVRLVGSAVVDGRLVSNRVETTAIVRSKRPALTLPPAWIEGLLSIATASEVQPWFETSWKQPLPALSAAKGRVTWELALEAKHKDFKGPLVVMVDGLPDAFSASVKQKDQKYQITLQGPKSAAPGVHRLQVIGYGTLKDQGQIAVSEAVLKIEQ